MSTLDKKIFATKCAGLLSHLLTRFGKQQKEFAAHVGLTRSAISTYVSGRRPIPKIRMVKFSEAFGIEPKSLMAAFERVESFPGEMTDGQIDALLDEMGIFPGNQPETLTINAPKPVRLTKLPVQPDDVLLPLLRRPLKEGETVEDACDGYRRVVSRFADRYGSHVEDCFLVIQHSNSMLGTVPISALIVVDPQFVGRPPDPDGIYISVVDDRFVASYIERKDNNIILRFLNSEYQNITIPEQEWRQVGRAVHYSLQLQGNI